MKTILSSHSLQPEEEKEEDTVWFTSAAENYGYVTAILLLSALSGCNRRTGRKVVIRILLLQ